MVNPSREIFVFILGDPPASKKTFSVVAPASMSVSRWKGQVYAEKRNRLKGYDAADLTLWKLNVPIASTSVDEQVTWPLGQDLSGIAKEMLPADDLSDYFPEPVPLPRKHLHVIVALPSLPSAGEKHGRLSEDDADGEPVAAKRRKLLTSSSVAPSTFGKPAVYKLDPENHAFNRPPSLETIPLALLHKIFGQFVQNAQTRVPTEADNALVRELRWVMSVVYDKEAELCHEFRKSVAKHYDVQFEAATIGSTSHQSDGHIRYKEFLCSVAEGKLLGRALGDPEVHACGYFITSIKQLYADRQGDFPDLFPCLIIYFTGPLVCFSGAVVTDRVQLETLTPAFSLHINAHDTEIALQAARAFGAFETCLRGLRAHYEALTLKMSNPKRPEARRLLFPYEDHYTAGDGERVQFDYLERLWTNKLIFTARNSKGDTLFIKFTRRYSMEAHQYCSEKGIASKLHAVEELPGGWMMVVMEFLGDKAYILPKLSKVETATLRDGLKAAVDILHQGGFVHGDIRDANVMVKTEWDTSGDANVRMLDFDWAGKVGKARYPPNVNFLDVKRPGGARDEQLITKEHDLEMLSYIFPGSVGS